MELNLTMNIGTIKLRATSKISLSQIDIGTSLVALMGKNLPAFQETQVGSQGWEDPLEEGMATLQYSSLENSMDRGVWQAMGSERAGCFGLFL